MNVGKLSLPALFLAMLLAIIIAMLIAGWFYVGMIVPSQPIHPVINSPVNENMAFNKRASKLSSDFLTRPMFWVNRRPQELAVEEVVEAKPVVEDTSLNELLVAGIYSDGNVSGMIGIYKNEKLRLAVGDELGGWVLDAVSEGGVLFRNNDQLKELKLERVMLPNKPKK